MQAIEALRFRRLPGYSTQGSTSVWIISQGCTEKKILAESELTLTKAVHIAQAAETARDEMHALRGKTTR